MRWQVTDVPATLEDSSDGTNHRSQGYWEASHGLGDIQVFNATTHGFKVMHAPCTIHSMSGMGTRIEPGAEGVIEATPSAPWVNRFDKVVKAMNACDTAVVGVIDAPDDIHIHQARAHVHKHREQLVTMMASQSKFLILEGHASQAYLTRPSDSDVPGGLVEHCSAPWHALQGYSWDLCVGTSMLDKVGRLKVALAHLWGTYEVFETKSLVYYVYPAGATVHSAMIPYISYGRNLDTSTAPRVSRTRGVTAFVTGRRPEPITVVCEFQDDKKEHREMALLRTMMTSDDTAEIGAAYFQLGAALPTVQCPKTQAIAREAMRAIDRKYATPRCTLVPPPIARNASCTPGATQHWGHSLWQ